MDIRFSYKTLEKKMNKLMKQQKTTENFHYLIEF